MDIGKIKAILFDFAGTLDYDGKDWAARLYDIFQKGNIILDKKIFSKAGKKASELLFNDKNSSRLSYREAVELFIYWILKFLNIIVENYKKSLADPFLADSYQSIDKNKKLLETLSKKFSLGIISNNLGNFENWCKELGIFGFFKIIIDSGVYGIKKPDKKIFLKASELLSLEPEECTFVGDNLEIDIKTPLKIKMLPIWINSEEKNNYKDVIKIKNLDELKIIFNIIEEKKSLI